tara:strand:+ start:134 stop:310 length:177 start_codon:yes stop_codon:yes gene_type:complete
MTTAKIEVFESPLSSNLIAKFNSIEELIAANKFKNYMADQIAINNCVLYGWDELYDFV